MLVGGDIKNRGFTLLELLIVIAILSILATIAAVLLNPTQILRESRDVRRFSDLDSVEQALSLASLHQIDLNGTQIDPNLLYLSIPDDGIDDANDADNNYDDCDELNLPALPTGWDYRCRTAADAGKVNGDGWIPVDLSSLQGGSPLSSFPRDPLNNGTNGTYYSYSVSADGNTFELNAVLESNKYRLSGVEDKVSRDGGDNFALFENGSELSISPLSDSNIRGYWKFDEGTGSAPIDSSGNNFNGVNVNNPTWIDGKLGKALKFDGVNQYVDIPDYGPGTASFTLSSWFKLSGTLGGDYYPIFGNNQCPPMLGYQTGGSTFIHLRQWATGSETASWDVGSPSAYADNAWHHAVLVVNQTDFKIELFIDGISRGTRNIGTEGYTHNNGDLTRLGAKYLGPGSCSIFFWKGELDDMRVYTRALSPAEIILIFNATR